MITMQGNNASKTDDLEFYNFDGLLQDSEVLLIIPPFSAWRYTSLACHLLQACAREAGISVSVLYANIVFAAFIGKESYDLINIDYFQLLGERLFSRAAYNLHPFGSSQYKYSHEENHSENELKLEHSKLQEIEEKTVEWIEKIAAAIVQRGFKIVGCSTSFQQTAASVALINAVKRLSPETITFVGGANCEGEMAEGITSLNAAIDFIFSGESEESFPKFLKQVLSGKTPSARIIQGSPCTNLDALPFPSNLEYFEQLEHFFPGAINDRNDEGIWLTYETSRGCWWGQKHQCTFCGLNGLGIQFREKSPNVVISELKRLVAESSTHNIVTTDNIMPYTYFKTLIPKLGTEIPNLHMHYEQKANLTLEKVVALRKAGIAEIQPGIEALSSSLLKRMRKGVSASQNVALLRYCLSTKMIVKWNLLYGFPGDQLYEYDETLALLPLLRHLSPPTGFYHVVIDRFSPYFDNAHNYNIANVKPNPIYASFLPPESNVKKLAYHFTGDYRSDSRENPEIVREINREVKAWQDAWNSSESQRPILHIQRLSEEIFILVDSRKLPQTEEIQFLNFEEAFIALCGRRSTQQSEMGWALERKLVVELDGAYVPLATANPELLQEFELLNHRMRLDSLSNAN
ncbi:MAG: RiPP maturation radical SAM protein 1 [Leptolyngbya sp. SIO1D8]|nr:RiPP maturation radical SAM protein 1 [Leptolyngbya sp. SIO1D8]